MSGITHSHVSAIADDPTKDVSSDEWNNDHVVGDLSVGGQVVLAGVITPAALGADQDDYNPAGLSGASVLRLSCSGTSRKVNGIAGGVDGREIVLMNVTAGTPYGITLPYEAGTSAAANRIAGTVTGVGAGKGIFLKPNSAVRLIYDGTMSRWKLLTEGQTAYLSTIYSPMGSVQIYADVEVDLYAGNINIGTTGQFPIINTPFLQGDVALYEGQVRENTVNQDLVYHDGQRERAANSVGWAPSAFPLGFMQSGTYTTSLALAAVSGGNGGSVAVPILVPGHMLVQSISFYNGTGTGSCEARLFRQYLNNGNAGENTLAEVAGVNFASRSNTGSAVQTVNITTPGTYIAPGLYWLVFRNTHASTVFALGSLAAGTMALANAQTKPIAALGSPLDLVAATWTKINSVVGCRLNGRVFGGGSAF